MLKKKKKKKKNHEVKRNLGLPAPRSRRKKLLPSIGISMSNAPRNDSRRRRREASSPSMGRATPRQRGDPGLSINVSVANFAIGISIDRDICSRSPLVALRYARRLCKSASLLTVRAQCTTATCRSSVSARTCLAGRYLSCACSRSIGVGGEEGAGEVKYTRYIFNNFLRNLSSRIGILPSSA